MEVIDLFGLVLAVGVAALGWAEWRRTRRADELHHLYLREAELTCAKLERDLAASPPTSPK